MHTVELLTFIEGYETITYERSLLYSANHRSYKSLPWMYTLPTSTLSNTHYEAGHTTATTYKSIHHHVAYWPYTTYNLEQGQGILGCFMGFPGMMLEANRN